MKHLKKFKTNEISSPAGSIDIDISGLSPLDRYNNANPAIELEEEYEKEDPNYMVKQNLKNLIENAFQIQKKLEMGMSIDEWAKDHVSTSADDIQEVLNFLNN